MPKLPLKQATDLADAMKKQGLAGSISMAEPMGADKDESDSDESQDSDMSELDHCLDDVADAVLSGDRDAIKSALRDAFEAFKAEDEEQDADMMQ